MTDEYSRQTKTIIRNKHFFHFILDKNSPKHQIIFILLNLSTSQLQSISEVLYNLLNNKNIKLSPSLKRLINTHKELLKTFVSNFNKNFFLQRKLLTKKYKQIFSVLHKAQKIILQSTS